MLHRLSIKLRFTLILAALVIGFSLFGIWTFYAMRTLNVNGPVYQRIVQGKDLVADALPPPEYIVESYLVALQLSNSSDRTETNSLISRLQKLKEEYDVRHQFWQKQSLKKSISVPLLETSYTAAQEFYQLALHQFIPAIQAADHENTKLTLQAMNRAYEVHRKAINEVVQAVNEFNANEEKQALETIHWNTIGLSGIFLLSILSAIVLTLLISRSVIRQLGGEPAYASQVAGEIANGNLDNIITLQSGDEQSILANMRNMQQQLLERITKEASEKANALRIQKALDSASSNVMMADTDYTIIYINDALIDTFKQAQPDIRKELPNFDVDKLLGANIDVFHKNPAHQRAMLDKMQTTLHSSFVVGGRQMDFIANPVFDEVGQRLGTVVEWQDQTLEVKIENEIKTIVESVKAGALESRLNVTDKTGFLQTLSMSINELTDVIEKVFNDIAKVMQSMAAGDLTHSITNDYDGVYGSCKQDINITLAKLSEVFAQIKDSADFINNSSREISSGNNNLSQRAEEQASSLEETASSMEELTGTVKNTADNAQQANTVANDARELAKKGGAIVNSAISAMQEINESSNKIAVIIAAIDEIAFQTNLLALNASVEAARAGEHGRGFSVVATEVRNLAQRSAMAAHQSKELIQNSIQKVRIGTEFVNQTGTALNDIATGVNNVGMIIAEIAAASAQQSAGIDQVNQAVAQMDEITQQNAALAEQASAASMSMSEQTTRMSDMLAFFQLGGSKEISAREQQPATNKSSTIITNAQTTGINLESAMQKHVEWKAKLRNAITRQEIMDVTTISKDDCCDFGKWLHGDGKLNYVQFDSFNTCLSKHAEFHKEAGKIAQTINDKKFAQAEAMMAFDSAYAKTSSAVCMAIVRLKKDLSRSENQPKNNLKVHGSTRLS